MHIFVSHLIILLQLTEGEFMNLVPPKLQRKLDREYGSDGWVYLGHDENNYIDIGINGPSSRVLSFSMWHWM